MTDKHEGPGGIPDAETMAAWAQEEDPAPSEDDELKETLRLQQFERKFVVPDAGDHLSDAELWEAMPKPWEKNA